MKQSKLSKFIFSAVLLCSSFLTISLNAQTVRYVRATGTTPAGSAGSGNWKTNLTIHSGITSAAPLGTLSYQWKRGGTIGKTWSVYNLSGMLI